MINQGNIFVKTDVNVAFLPEYLAHKPGQDISCRWPCGSADVTVFYCDFGLICKQKFASTDLFIMVVLENQGEML